MELGDSERNRTGVTTLRGELGNLPTSSDVLPKWAIPLQCDCPLARPQSFLSHTVALGVREDSRVLRAEPTSSQTLVSLFIIPSSSPFNNSNSMPLKIKIKDSTVQFI